MFGTVLAALDGSPRSEVALAKAIDEARLWKASLHAVYVIETGLFSSIPLDNTWEVIFGLLESQGKEALKAAEQKAAAAGVTITPHMAQGHAGSEILTLAKKVGADLIVVGSHGKSNIDRLLLGSVSSYVVKYSTITTLVVRS
ncbi:MAG: universal stress protein [Methanomicrobiales archaeon]|nr:universal stress protein [Methanomicrobiales archaeon]